MFYLLKRTRTYQTIEDGKLQSWIQTMRKYFYFNKHSFHSTCCKTILLLKSHLENRCKMALFCIRESSVYRAPNDISYSWQCNQRNIISQRWSGISDREEYNFAREQNLLRSWMIMSNVLMLKAP